MSDGFTSERSAKELVNEVHGRLHALALKYVREWSDRALDPADLVHEAYLRLEAASDAGARWESQEHFLAVAARAMRQILVDDARRRGAGKRGGGWTRVTLTGLDDAQGRVSMTDVLALGDALAELQQRNPRQSEIVSLRLFGGLTVPQIADRLGLSESSVEKEWKVAREWLSGQVVDPLPK
ncbi:MAG TPA: ECF-type sigma factor [Polyangiaceae bacterium LLY-WYZ-14_1]|nr:ECF-type sigma factor [Polyangiaceae bacterium LLY-WYZ-14_1]